MRDDPDLPFGGIGPSGIGAIHGRSGFDTFSKLLPCSTSAASPGATCSSRRTAARSMR